MGSPLTWARYLLTRIRSSVQQSIRVRFSILPFLAHNGSSYLHPGFELLKFAKEPSLSVHIAFHINELLSSSLIRFFHGLYPSNWPLPFESFGFGLR